MTATTSKFEAELASEVRRLQLELRNIFDATIQYAYDCRDQGDIINEKRHRFIAQKVLKAVGGKSLQSSGSADENET